MNTLFVLLLVVAAKGGPLVQDEGMSLDARVQVASCQLDVIMRALAIPAEAAKPHVQGRDYLWLLPATAHANSRL